MITIIPINPQSRLILEEIIKKYNLKESSDESLKKINQQKPLNEIVIIRLARNLILKKVSNEEFLNGLQKDLSISKEKTKNIAIDILHNLVPKLKKYTEEELKNYDPSQETTEEQEEKSAFANALKARDAERKADLEAKKAPLPYGKKIETTDVDKNAEELKKAKIALRQQQEQPQENISKGPDSYREPID